ncbi:hypothetical protein SERLA73DRAFT_139696 [Serpula lacrymans var. lacrymans S7.3]|uniref:Uncharacterized protein n=1 Tax=Serpula lacrymans var. lacrymans (strain S7.3) TaxID=936435 RepID=F8Q2Q5_SERL3|nr:hypothetical protein SERLA73DRAFT_139696 [Serpula lacrymans var. lacrymans S7.3]
MLSPGMYVVLTTPNGWEGRQQNSMRLAAIAAGLVSVDGGRRVSFVTESEAAVLYAASTGNIDEWLQVDTDIIVCDCGGGTIDITGYTIMETKPLRLKESIASSCYLNGGMFVGKALEQFLQRFFFRYVLWLLLY